MNNKRYRCLVVNVDDNLIVDRDNLIMAGGYGGQSKTNVVEILK